MRNILIIVAMTLLLTGCPNPRVIKNSFPDLPENLMSSPKEMKPIDSTGVSLKTAPTDISPSGIPLSTVAKIISDNYTTCNLNKEQLMLLQQWAREQKKLNP
jgi:hypothetical protein